MGHLIHFKAMMKFLARKINYVEESLPYDWNFSQKVDEMYDKIG